MSDMPKVVDDDNGTITTSFQGTELRGWSYDNDSERRAKIQMAHWFVEGWLEGFEHGHSVGRDEGFDNGYKEGLNQHD